MTSPLAHLRKLNRLLSNAPQLRDFLYFAEARNSHGPPRCRSTWRRCTSTPSGPLASYRFHPCRPSRSALPEPTASKTLPQESALFEVTKALRPTFYYPAAAAAPPTLAPSDCGEPEWPAFDKLEQLYSNVSARQFRPRQHMVTRSINGCKRAAHNLEHAEVNAARDRRGSSNATKPLQYRQFIQADLDCAPTLRKQLAYGSDALSPSPPQGTYIHNLTSTAPRSLL